MVDPIATVAASANRSVLTADGSTPPARRTGHGTDRFSRSAALLIAVLAWSRG